MNVVDVLAEMPCLVTDKKACELEADPIASMAIWSEPSVPFLNPIGIDIPEASSRCTCDSVAASATGKLGKGSVRETGLKDQSLLSQPPSLYTEDKHSLLAPMAPHETRSAMYCGEMVSRSSHADGRPMLAISSKSPRASRRPLLIWYVPFS